MRSLTTYFLYIIIFLGFSACETNRWEIPDEEKKVKQEWKRFDLALLKASEKEVDKSEIQELEKKFPKFLPLYLEGVMRFGALGSKEANQILQKFLSDENILELFEAVAEKYPKGSLNKQAEVLADGFSRYHYYFPERSIPEITTFVSAFTYSTVVDDSLLGIGLDTYLGKDFKLYAQAGIPKYKFKHFEEEYLVSDALKAWFYTEFEVNGGQNLLEQMIYHGKIIYLTQSLLPENPEYLALNYNQQENQWCEENEEEIWFHFVEMELLHSIENHKIRKYMGEAPFIAGFPEGSPGRVGQWVGTQIVSAYMENHPEVSLSDLMKMDNADRILQESKYKPKR